MFRPSRPQINTLIDPELLALTLAFLETKDLFSARLVCKQWQLLMQNTPDLNQRSSFPFEQRFFMFVTMSCADLNAKATRNFEPDDDNIARAIKDNKFIRFINSKFINKEDVLSEPSVRRFLNYVEGDSGRYNKEDVGGLPYIFECSLDSKTNQLSIFSCERAPTILLQNIKKLSFEVPYTLDIRSVKAMTNFYGASDSITLESGRKELERKAKVISGAAPIKPMTRVSNSPSATFAKPAPKPAPKPVNVPNVKTTSCSIM